MESLGTKIRKRRKRLALTLDDLATQTHISKPYLSLIETGRVANPPGDEKLRRLEHFLQFQRGELLAQAHLQKTPEDVRAVLSRLVQNGNPISIPSPDQKDSDQQISAALCDIVQSYHSIDGE
jgi:transcriptional regulator with XRE-family HTH domain